MIRRGGRLYAVAGEPVLLMYGAVPAYRTLAEGVTEGRDVEQLPVGVLDAGTGGVIFPRHAGLSREVERLKQRRHQGDERIR